MANKQEDQYLEDYLQGDSALSEAYRAEKKSHPPTHLDKAILSVAKEAVRSDHSPKVAYSPFARTWYVPASMAAVLMLCVGLVFTIYDDSGQILLTSPKSEYDFDAQIAPMPMAIEPAQPEEPRASGENSRQLEYAKEIPDEVELSMDKISGGNEPVPASIEVSEKKKSELLHKPASKFILREKATEMDDASLPETSTDIFLKRDASKRTMSDSLQLPERRDASGRLQAADVKKKNQLDANDLNNNSGEMEMKDIEQDSGTRSAQESSYRQELEGLPKQNESLKKEALGNDMAAEGFTNSVESLGDEVLTPEHWLKLINNLWVSGDQQIAKENLTLFFETYPDYSIENAKAILDPQIDLTEYIR